MARRKIKSNRQFWESAITNNKAFTHYYNRLLELSISMFEWKNLPDSVDPIYLEKILFAKGQAIFFHDEDIITEKENDTVIGNEGYLALSIASLGHPNIYGIPKKRSAFAVNGYYNGDLTDKNSVIIYNNMIRTPAMIDIELFAKRLADLDRIIDVNVNAQKTPVLILADETQRLTMKNLYMQYEGNEPFIFGDKKLNTNDSIKALSTDAPYLADKLYTLKTQIWNEALTYLGISNINITKKERLITDEVTRNQGGVIASRYSRLEARRQACRMINDMFGFDGDNEVWVDYREDYQQIEDAKDTVEGDPNSDGEGGVIDE